MPSIRDKKDEKTSTTNETEPVKNNQFVTKDELDSFGATLITQLTGLLKKELDVHKDTIGQSTAIPAHEIGKDTRGIEAVAPALFKVAAELEAFMNDIITIYVHPSGNKEDNPVIVPNVNGINQPIIRGQECKVKRKYVEALARNRVTRYEQKIPDASKPHQYVMAPDTVVAAPFTVRNDPDPRGAEWLRGILAER